MYHCITREHLLEFPIQLSSKSLIIGDHQHWFVKPLNNIRHRKGLSRTCNPQQSLELIAILKPFDQGFNGLQLVTGKNFPVRVLSPNLYILNR